MNWFRRARNRAEAPRLRPRSTDAAATRVDLADLTPVVDEFLGKAAYLELTIFENLSRAVVAAPSADAKANLSSAAALALAKYQALAAEIERAGYAPGDLMEPNRVDIDRFQRLTQGADWFETVTTCYVAAGFLDDFLVKLAAGLPPAIASRVIEAMSVPSGERILAAELLAAIEANPRLAARLALWGRRLVGDTMLVARSTIAASENHDSDEQRIEPVFTELIAAHTRRMDVLGLTA